jgi:hypothetical protein
MSWPQRCFASEALIQSDLAPVNFIPVGRNAEKKHTFPLEPTLDKPEAFSWPCGRRVGAAQNSQG